MGRLQHATTIVWALCAGLVGGGVSSQFLAGTPALAEKTIQEPQVIRAEKFEVVDKNGRVRGELGLRSDGVPVLRLYDEDGAPRVGFSPKADEGHLWSVR
ncbi:MAG TPA: hypothetical protein VNN62_03165 [Methylomirabilota bacterium]|nr:hypothetical protein [Methylomirabilota bacterium]